MCVRDFIKAAFQCQCVDSVFNFPLPTLIIHQDMSFLVFCWSKEELADVAWHTLPFSAQPSQACLWPDDCQGCRESDLKVMPVGCYMKTCSGVVLVPGAPSKC